MSTRSPGRPRQFDSAAVVDKAVELFWRQGYRATTTRHMQDALGLAQSSIYNTFGSKQNLLELALDRYEARTADVLLTPLCTARDGLAGIDAFFAGLGEWIGQEGRYGCMLTNLAAEDGGMTPSIRERGRAYRERVREEFEAALARSVGDGQLDAGTDVIARSKLLLSLVLGLTVTARANGKDELQPAIAAIRREIASWRRDAA